jgi:hypothetical protein
MVRRALVVLAAVVAVVGGLALPANAYPAACSYYSRTVTTVMICVDVNGSFRSGYVRATSTVPPMTLTVSPLELWQYSPTSGWDEVEWDYGVRAGTTSAEFYGTPWLVQFGHTYQACAYVTVGYGVVLSDDYGYICSGYVDN